MSNKTAAVKVQDPQLEETQELNTMDENMDSLDKTQEPSDLQQILQLLLGSQTTSAELKTMLQTMPDVMLERIKPLLKPTEVKSESLLIAKENQGIAEEQLRIAKQNSETLQHNRELLEANQESENQQITLLQAQQQTLDYHTSLLEQLTNSKHSQMPSSELDSSES